jgi:hypothetical protein
MSNTTGAVFSATVGKSPNLTQKPSFKFTYRDPNAIGKGNVNCADTTNPNRGDPSTCGASWSQTVSGP